MSPSVRRIPLSWTVLALALSLAAACGGNGGPTEEVVLADYQFKRISADSLYGVALGQDVGLNWFSTGWDEPRGGALWSTGPRGVLILEALGRDATLQFICTTPSRLAAQGQTISVELNGHAVGSFPLGPGWDVDTCLVHLPDDLIEQGANEVAFLPSAMLPSKRPGHRGSRRGFALRSLRVTAQLTAKQKAKWQELNESPPPDPAWSTLVLPKRENAHERRDEARPEVKPDLLMILMDTCRADHFSAFGYGRETTPALDRLAREGVLLRNVIAEAPYTLASVPSLMTGRSWREHKVQHNGEALAEDFVTLAELLQSAGYETLAISDNPNVSVACNTDQGFDEFYEMWKKSGAADDVVFRGYHPDVPVEAFEKRLAKGLPEGPVFFYVHTMFPHAPYFPGEEHDLFKPAGYHGKITGTVEQMQEFDRGSRPAKGPAYQRLVTLYDGSLHRGDASVERILQAWKALKRDRPLLLVFVSDHGEGFGEHGHFSHGSTPFDEMLHVPVIFHPAALVPGLSKSAGNLRTLSDVTAILLHYLDVHLPPDTAWPRRFLEVLEDPSAPRQEIFIRCRQPRFALRTATSLTVLDLWESQAYFDLAEDPHARTNLRLTRADDYLRQLRRLRSFLEHEIGTTTAQAAELTDEDRARLRSLGYM